MNIKKIIWLIIGLVSLVFAGIGIVLPMMPYVPFLMLSTFCFAKSSERLHNWIINTKVYKQNLDSFAKGKGMTIKAKIRIIITVTIVMGTGFIAMFLKKVYIPAYILLVVWAMHVLIFTFVVKTYIPEEERKKVE